MTEFSYLQNTADVFTYQGREYENISLDEATQHEETVFKILRTSNRTSKPELRKQGFIPSMLLTGNPGGIGNAWVKRIFIERNFKDEEEPADFDFVQAFVADNPALLSADPDYIKRLQGLPESLRRAYLDGDWNVLGGMAFAELNERTHLIDAFALPVGTKYFAGYDHGFNHPFAFVLFALTPDDKMYCVKYYKDRLLRPDEIAKGIIELTANCGRVDIYAGHDLWARGRDGGPTIYEQFVEAGINGKNGLHIHRAKIDRKQGVSEIRKFVAWRNTTTGEPKLKFFKNTRPVFDNVAGMQFDMKEPEDVLKIDADEDGQGGDDLYDSCLVKGTQVLTDRGNRNIEDIKVGDLVMTRVGLKPVLASGITNNNANVFKANFSNGASLIGTSNHPIYVKGQGFTSLKYLRYGDTLEVCSQNLLSTITKDTIDHQTQSLGNGVFTTTAEAKPYIELFGKIILGLYQKAIKYIMSTETHLITKYPIYNALVQRITSGYILVKDLKNSYVKLVAEPIKGSVRDFVQTLARAGIDVRPKLMMWRRFVPFAIRPIKPVDSSQQTHVQTTVVQVTDICPEGIDTVYNITVDEQPEYYANGVLVHNCRYSLMSRNYPTVAELQYADNTAMKILQDHLREKQLQRESEY